MTSRALATIVAVPAATALAAACGSETRVETAPELLPVPPQTATVNETLRVPLTVNNPSGLRLDFTFVAPPLPGLESVARVAGTPQGGEFIWTPLASHVGAHEITFVITSTRGESRQATLVTVQPARDTAPIFLRPGPGGTHDLTRDPCVRFDLEVRDDDSADVAVTAASPLPDGATIAPAGTHRARFEWCPTPAQVERTLRWNLVFAADDGDHPPTLHAYVAVLRAPARENCPGEPPVVRIASPGAGDRVASATGYEVVAEVSDDQGLRDAPLLYYTTETPDDPTRPDLTTFRQATFAGEAPLWRGRVPDLGLDEGEEQAVYLVVSAIDNDDASGARCDHRTDSRALRFIAAGAAGTASQETCAPCEDSGACASGVCGAGAFGGRCVPACTVGADCDTGPCASVTTVSGEAALACGDADSVCGEPVEPCTDDDLEDNDSVDDALPIPFGDFEGQACPWDYDYFEVTTPAGAELRVTLDFVHADGDVDLELVDARDVVLAQSAGVTDHEEVTWCAGSDDPLYARVSGYAGASNHYAIAAETTGEACCPADAYEPNDTADSAASVPTRDVAEGRACPHDDDWFAVDVEEPRRIVIDLVFDHANIDIDGELYDPNGALLVAANGIEDEHVEVDAYVAGRYTLRVFGFGEGDTGPYLLSVELGAPSPCGDANPCPAGLLCGAGGLCAEAPCARAGDCPAGYLCPADDPVADGARCVRECVEPADCPGTEWCKWTTAGPGCGPDGTRSTGDGCAAAGECAGARTCVNWPGGYCARAGCTSAADCGEGTHCVEAGGLRACALDCRGGEGACRLAEGYACAGITDVAGATQRACVPAER